MDYALTVNVRRGGFYLGRADAFQGWQFPARGEQSILYRNLGGGKFEDVSRKLGLEHRGWSAIRPDHPVRHGQEVAAFIRMMGMWWGDQMTAMRLVALRAGDDAYICVSQVAGDP